jgi:tRNA 2-selenouridine synthase
MIHGLSAEEFLRTIETTPCFDLRSPAEFERGHIPGAVNIPLFDNEERARIGTLYRQKGRAVAMEIGLEIVASKVILMLNSFKQHAPGMRIALHCWRGGMRSSSVAWMLDLYGFHVSTLKGGYKAYRHHQEICFQQFSNIRILGGYTGSAKTELLLALKQEGHQVIDLEGIARHRGSAFGWIKDAEQPSSEQFMNEVFHQLRQLNPEQPVWMEDESRSIGCVYLSPTLFARIKSSPMLMLDIPQAERILYLKQIYGDVSPGEVRSIIDKLQKRMGGQHVKAALQALDEGNSAEVLRLLLNYYDKSYRHSMAGHSRTVYTLAVETISIPDLSKQIALWIKQAKKQSS